MSEVEERLDALETRIAFQDQTIETLNVVVTAQQEQLDVVTKRLQLLVEQVGTGLVSKDDDSAPPHY